MVTKQEQNLLIVRGYYLKSPVFITLEKSWQTLLIKIRKSFRIFAHTPINNNSHHLTCGPKIQCFAYEANIL